MKVCDNSSVGIVITDEHGRYLMFDRNTFPPGTASAAGHIDEHGTAEDAARAEVEEELGLTITGLTHVTGWWRNNRCRRLPGARGVGHDWTVYQATVTGDLTPSARETKNVRWLTPDALQALANRTAAYAQGHLTEAEFTASPGIEPVWMQWLANLGAIHVSPYELRQVQLLASGMSVAPHPSQDPGSDSPGLHRLLNTTDASRVHYTDPRVRALAYTRWHLTTGGTHTDWLALGKDNPAALIEGARDWLRAAVALGLLPLVEPSTGRALSTVPLSVDPSTGTPAS
ncbi:NUDIX hydrolase [Streptomyces prunicolor]|uniref:NUDIX hydrolase n=1 Tax=Streptomyces prunicolor TaxID=67348 RepID=UPI0003692D3A|nr:NUDIX hydrolase [Streptomyces prunicolor]